MEVKGFKMNPWLMDKLTYGLKGASSRGAGLAILGTAVMALAGGYLMYRRKRGQGLLEDLGMRGNGGEREVTIKRKIIVNRPLEDVFNFWRDFDNFPQFMRHIDSVTKTGKMVSHWVARAPGGKRIEWDSEITEIKENELIRWRSLAGSDVHNEGQVMFRKTPEGGTEVEVEFTYHPEESTARSRISKFLNFLTSRYIKGDLWRFKHILEKSHPSVVGGFEKTLAQT